MEKCAYLVTQPIFYLNSLRFGRLVRNRLEVKSGRHHRNFVRVLAALRFLPAPLGALTRRCLHCWRSQDSACTRKVGEVLCAEFLCRQRETDCLPGKPDYRLPDASIERQTWNMQHIFGGNKASHARILASVIRPVHIVDAIGCAINQCARRKIHRKRTPRLRLKPHRRSKPVRSRLRWIARPDTYAVITGIALQLRITVTPRQHMRHKRLLEDKSRHLRIRFKADQLIYVMVIRNPVRRSPISNDGSLVDMHGQAGYRACNQIDTCQKIACLEGCQLADTDPGVSAAAIKNIEQPLSRIAEWRLRIFEAGPHLFSDSLALLIDEFAENACLQCHLPDLNLSGANRRSYKSEIHRVE